MSKETRLYRGSVLDSTSGSSVRFYREGALIVGDEGQIIAAGEYAKLQPRFKGAKEHSVGDRLIIPGLVDCHVHLAQYEVVAREEEGLLPWLERHVYPAEASFSDTKKARRVSRLFFKDLGKNGTTTSSVFVTVHKEATEVAFEEAKRAGVRAVIGKVMMDANAPEDLLEDTDKSIKDSEELCKRWNGASDGRLMYAFTPRFALTSTQRLLNSASKLAAKYDAHIQTHLAENLDEVRLARRQFPGTETYTGIYRAAGLIRRKAVFAHCIHMDRKEIQILANAVSGVAYCPQSNLFLRSGFLPLRDHLSSGVNLGLGSDVAGGAELSIFRQMGSSGYASKASLMKGEAHGALVDPKLAFHMATLGGARALGLADSVGNFEPGKRADFLVVDTRSIDTMKRTPQELDEDEILSLLMYRGDERCVERAYVDGRPL